VGRETRPARAFVSSGGKGASPVLFALRRPTALRQAAAPRVSEPPRRGPRCAGRRREREAAARARAARGVPHQQRKKRPTPPSPPPLPLPPLARPALLAGLLRPVIMSGTPQSKGQAPQATPGTVLQGATSTVTYVPGVPDAHPVVVPVQRNLVFGQVAAKEAEASAEGNGDPGRDPTPATTLTPPPPRRKPAPFPSASSSPSSSPSSSSSSSATAAAATTATRPPTNAQRRHQADGPHRRRLLAHGVHPARWLRVEERAGGGGERGG
jgi:hypothetical protein